MSTDRMTVHELAKSLGKSPMWVVDELRRDSKRETSRWPFATSSLSKTGRWSYVIIRTQFLKWKAGDVTEIDYERLDDMVSDRVLGRLAGKGAQKSALRRAE